MKCLSKYLCLRKRELCQGSVWSREGPSPPAEVCSVMETNTGFCFRGQIIADTKSSSEGSDKPVCPSETVPFGL